MSCTHGDCPDEGEAPEISLRHTLKFPSHNAGIEITHCTISTDDLNNVLIR